ncbi:MAG: hypothetical protein ACOZF0_16655 [Thermodesulfobacteriota bacterium]
MLLRIKGVKTKHAIHEVDPDAGEDSFFMKPKHLVTLGEVAWPEWVKEDIAQQFRRIGIQDPYKQKLVEPFAMAFGGRNNDGAYDLSRVKWEMVVDYFRWESAAWDRDTPEKEKALKLMIAEIKAKYGGMFNHQMVYDDRK